MTNFLISPPASMAEAEERDRRARIFGYLERRRDLVAFAALADWYGRESADKKAWALQDLGNAAMRGEFGPTDRPIFYYMPAHLPLYRPFWIKRSGWQVGAMRARNHDETADLWAPRRLCVKWLVARQIPLPPWLLADPEPIEVASPPAAPVGRPAKTVSAAKVRAWLNDKAKKAKVTGIILNREETIRLCMAALGCNREMARQGFEQVPDDVRKPPGRPQKPGGK